MSWNGKSLVLGLVICSRALFADGLEARVAAIESALGTMRGEIRALRAENEALGRENARLRAERALEALKLAYPVNDQHDSIAVSYQETLTDIATNRLEKAARLVAYEQLKEASSHGAIPEATMRLTELNIALDAASERGLAFKREAQAAKLRSLEGLRDGNVLAFARGDRDTNLAQLRWFEQELGKAVLTAAHAADLYHRIHELYLQGSAPWARDHETKLESDKTAVAVEGWKRKVAEQEKQYRAAEEELKKLEHPG